MATVRELLEQRTQELAELLDRIRDETQGDIDLTQLTELSDELGARADAFAQTLTSARETLEGSGAEEGEEGPEDGGSEGEEGAGEGAAAAEDASETPAAAAASGGGGEAEDSAENRDDHEGTEHGASDESEAGA